MSPAVGISKPASIIKVVVLPDPDGPSSVRNSPFRIEKLNPLMTRVSPSYVFRTSIKRTKPSSPASMPWPLAAVPSAAGAGPMALLGEPRVETDRVVVGMVAPEGCGDPVVGLHVLGRRRHVLGDLRRHGADHRLHRGSVPEELGEFRHVAVFTREGDELHRVVLHLRALDDGPEVVT